MCTLHTELSLLATYLHFNYWQLSNFIHNDFSFSFLKLYIWGSLSTYVHMCEGASVGQRHRVSPKLNYRLFWATQCWCLEASMGSLREQHKLLMAFYAVLKYLHMEWNNVLLYFNLQMHFLLHFYLSIFFPVLKQNKTKPGLLTWLIWGDEWILPLDQDHGGQTDPCMLFLWSSWLTGMFCILLNSQHHTSSKFMMPRTFEVSLRVHLFSYAVPPLFLAWNSYLVVFMG